MLHGAYREHLYRWAQGKLGPQRPGGQSASDIVQETQVRADQHLDSFKGQSQGEWEAWLRHIQANLIRQSYRNAKRKKRHGKLLPLEEATDLPKDQITPSQQAAQHEECEQLGPSLMQLPEAQRTAVVLRHYYQYSLGEIAEALGGTPQTVGELIRNGLAALRAQGLG